MYDAHGETWRNSDVENIEDAPGNAVYDAPGETWRNADEEELDEEELVVNPTSNALDSDDDPD